jgi:hypothetical protein
MIRYMQKHEHVFVPEAILYANTLVSIIRLNFGIGSPIASTKLMATSYIYEYFFRSCSGCMIAPKKGD